MRGTSICHVLLDEYPKDTRVRRYVNTNLRLGLKVFVVCAQGGAQPWFEEKDGELTVIRLPVTKRRSSMGRRLVEYTIFQVASFFVVSFLAVARGTRIYHVHTLPDFLVFACLVPRLLGSRIILDFHELFPEFMMQHRPRYTVSSLVIRTLILQEGWSLHFATDAIAFHDPALEILRSRHGPRRPITVIMNAVDPSEFPQVDRKDTETFQIVYNGTINFNLHLDLVIRALDLLRTKRTDVYDKVQFSLYGDGPDLTNLLDLAKELGITNVRYHGRLEFGKMMTALATASVCILPPTKDVYSDLYYSLKMTEMIYLKIPIIATRLDTYQRYFPEGCIKYFESGNVVELAQRLCEIYDDPESGRSMAAQALSRYQEFAWPVMERRYQDLILAGRSTQFAHLSAMGPGSTI